MKCPLILMAYLHRTGEIPPTQADCFKEECAWWDEDKNCCSVKVIAKELSYIMIKMPHQEQFMK